MRGGNEQGRLITIHKYLLIRLPNIAKIKPSLLGHILLNYDPNLSKIKDCLSQDNVETVCQNRSRVGVLDRSVAEN